MSDADEPHSHGVTRLRSAPSGQEDRGRVSDVLEAVRAHLAAYNAADVERVVQTLSEDAEFVAGDEAARGRPAVRTWFGASFTGDAAAHLTLDEVDVVGPTARCALTSRLSYAGTVVEIPVAATFTVHGGLVTRIDVDR